MVRRTPSLVPREPPRPQRRPRSSPRAIVLRRRYGRIRMSRRPWIRRGRRGPSHRRPAQIQARRLGQDRQRRTRSTPRARDRETAHLRTERCHRRAPERIQRSLVVVRSARCRSAERPSPRCRARTAGTPQRRLPAKQMIAYARTEGDQGRSAAARRLRQRMPLRRRPMPQLSTQVFLERESSSCVHFARAKVFAAARLQIGSFIDPMAADDRGRLPPSGRVPHHLNRFDLPAVPAGKIRIV